MRSFPVIWCFTLFSFFAGTFACAKEPAFRFDRIGLVWTANYNNQEEQVFFSNYVNKEWSVPIQISDSKSYVLQADGSINLDGTIWVVWTEVEKKGYFLHFSMNRNNRWLPAEKIYTGMNDNREPVIITDSSGTPLIVWTGVDDNYSDLFWSRWAGGRWSKPQKVHADNSVPDVNPSFSTNGAGEIELSWQTFSDESPAMASLRWNGNGWGEGSITPGKKKLAIEKMRRENFPHLPKFVQESYKASFLYKDNYGAGRIPVIRL